MDVSAPLTTWMQRGGDRRQVPDPQTGLTRYRITTRPREGVPFGSCTASWPGRRAWRAMEAELARWREADRPAESVEATALNIRRRLRAIMGLGDEARLALTPSGTDAIYLVTAVALRGTERVHHVVVGASELGGGTLGASAGRTFSDRVPHPGPAGPPDSGAAVPGLEERTSAVAVYLRDGQGQRRPLEEVDAEVVEKAERAAAEGARVVVHLVAHSKTGLRAPSVEALQELGDRLGDRLVVLVDAAQGRVAPSDVAHALDLGFMVLWTGSKFYCGPPFSSVLLFPSSFADDPGPLPDGLDQWLTPYDLPREWVRARSSLRVDANPGLYLRWIGGLEETEAYHAIPGHRRGRVYHTFAGAVLEVFGPSHRLVLDMPRAPDHRLATGLGAFPSVFGFRVRDDAGWLTADRLKRLHALLDTDLSAEDVELGGRYHLGQPVSLGPPGDGVEAVLRVALGARLVTELAASSDAGAAWLRSQMYRVRRKAELIVEGGRA